MPRTAWTSPKSLVTPEIWTAGTGAALTPVVPERLVCVMPQAWRTRDPEPSHRHHEIAVTVVIGG